MRKGKQGDESEREGISGVVRCHLDRAARDLGGVDQMAKVREQVW